MLDSFQWPEYINRSWYTHIQYFYLNNINYGRWWTLQKLSLSKAVEPRVLHMWHIFLIDFWQMLRWEVTIMKVSVEEEQQFKPGSSSVSCRSLSLAQNTGIYLGLVVFISKSYFYALIYKFERTEELWKWHHLLSLICIVCLTCW